MTTPLPADAETLFARLRDSLKDALGASCNGQAQEGPDALAGVDPTMPVGESAAGSGSEAAQAGSAEAPAFIGIHTGGAWLAARLHAELGLSSPLGFLSSAFYRDDVQARGLSTRMQPTRIDFDVNGRDIVLVDDILHTGRTIRAALNEIFDYGRPARVRLAVLIDRGERELPVQPDHVGTRLVLQPGEKLALSQRTNGMFELRVETVQA